MSQQMKALVNRQESWLGLHCTEQPQPGRDRCFDRLALAPTHRVLPFPDEFVHAPLPIAAFFLLCQ